MSPKVSVIPKRGNFFLSKSQWKGVSFNFGERSYVLPFADEWRDRGGYPLALARFRLACLVNSATLLPTGSDGSIGGGEYSYYRYENCCIIIA